MKNKKLSRRSFIRNITLAGAGTVAAPLGVNYLAFSKTPVPAETSKILNYNSKMGYRRLGKTELMISEIGLGGHWKTPEGYNMWGKFANDEVPEDVQRNRTEVVSRCLEHGINYLDVTGPSESLSYGNALKGRRNMMYIAADDCNFCPREEPYCNVKGQMTNIEACLRYLGTDYLDIWRPSFKMDGKSSDSDIEVCVETFEKAREQGKVRWLGMSSHSRTFIQHLIENYSQYSVIIFPYTAKSKVKPANIKAVDPEQIFEQGSVDAKSSDPAPKSIFDLTHERDLGVTTIKPLSGGSIFSNHFRFGTNTTGTEEDYELARLTLAYVLCNSSISAALTGMTTVRDVDNNIRASAERLSLLDQNGIWKLCKAAERTWNDLPEEYRWLRDWEWV